MTAAMARGLFIYGQWKKKPKLQNINCEIFADKYRKLVSQYADIKCSSDRTSQPNLEVVCA